MACARLARSTPATGTSLTTRGREKRRQLSTALSETLRSSFESSEQEAYPHLKLSGVVPLPIYLAECLAAIVDIVVGAFEIGTTDTKPGRIGKVEELGS